MKSYISVRWFDLESAFIDIEPALLVSLSNPIRDDGSCYYEWLHSEEELCNFILIHSEYIRGIIKQ